MLFLIKKTVSSFLLPPGLWLLFLLVAFIFFRKEQKRMAKGVLTLGVALYYLSMTPWLTLGLWNWWVGCMPSDLEVKVEEFSPQAILVLGAGSQKLSSKDQKIPSSQGLERLRFASSWAKRLELPILSCGGGMDRILSEGYAGKLFLQELGCERVDAESESVDTWGNFVFAKKWMRQRGYERVLVVTQDVHCRRATEIARLLEVDALVIGYQIEVGLKGDLNAWGYLLDALPDKVWQRRNQDLMHEMLGYAFLFLRQKFL